MGRFTFRPLLAPRPALLPFGLKSYPSPAGIGGAPSAQGKFPLAAHASGRYFIDAQGVPFFPQIDAGWYVELNLTTTEITT